MACNLNKHQIGQIVLAVIQAMNHNNPNIKPDKIGPDTSFDDDIGDDPTARRRYRKPIVLILDHHGCTLLAKPADFASCGKVKDMIQRVADNVS